MMKKNKTIVIVGGARDYHVMDWYRTIYSLVPERKVILLTDLIGGEGFKVLINERDKIEKLFIIDDFLFSRQTRGGDIWRNVFKLLVLPYQVFLLKKYAKYNPDSIFHAQPMYYMFLCWFAGVEFIGTPQGSEILVRPKISKLYSFFANKTLNAAKYVTVDSQSMKNGIYDLSKKEAIIIQNGIDINEISNFINFKEDKLVICSMRGMTSLYRIVEIVRARNMSSVKSDLTLIYPFQDEIYKSEIIPNLQSGDVDLGRLGKQEMYKLLASSLLVISIPKSDSSPRSVYESIFLGACVAVTYNSWIDVLPQCMKDRLFIIDINDAFWFDKAVNYARNISKTPFIPSEEALEMFDQKRTMKKAIELLY
jgi:hypothetical protein